MEKDESTRFDFGVNFNTNISRSQNSNLHENKLNNIIKYKEKYKLRPGQL